jgi:SET domain-containing protein
MADITMCKGTDCPFKETCYRYTAPISDYQQSYFFEPPIIKGEEISCDYYWEYEEHR